MPKGVPGSGPYAGRRKGNGQKASDGATTGSAAAAATGRGRGGKGRKSASKSTGRRGRGQQMASTGQQRADTITPPGSNSTSANNNATEINGIKIEVMPVPSRGGRPQQSEAFPFAALDVATKNDKGDMVGPSFVIPDDKNADNILAAARKRHKGKTFTARKMDVGVRIWRLA